MSKRGRKRKDRKKKSANHGKRPVASRNSNGEHLRPIHIRALKPLVRST